MKTKRELAKENKRLRAQSGRALVTVMKKQRELLKLGAEVDALIEEVRSERPAASG